VTRGHLTVTITIKNGKGTPVTTVKRYAVALVIGGWLVARPPISHAQTAADKAAADTLFEQAKKRYAAGDIAGACALFDASLKKFEQLGTHIALATCYERLGKTASAWAQFHAAAAAAGKAHDKRQGAAEDHAASLEPRLSKLVVKLEPGYRVDRLEVRRDNAVVSEAELGAAIAVDPGDHVIEANAPGWQKWEKGISIMSPGTVEVIVPALGKAPLPVEEIKVTARKDSPPPVASPSPASVVIAPRRTEPAAAVSQSPRSQRLLGYGLAGGGTALVIGSLAVGAVASSRWSDAQPHCQDRKCDQTGLDLAHGAQTMGDLSTGLFVAGAAAAGISLYLLVTANSGASEKAPPAGALRIAPQVEPTRAGVSLQGVF
jgi:hypothetical protein